MKINLDDALHMQAIISGLGKPQEHELDVLGEMLLRSYRDESYLKGDDYTVWDKLDGTEDPDDLIVIKAPMELDSLTNLFVRFILFFKSYGFRQRFLEIFGVVSLIHIL